MKKTAEVKIYTKTVCPACDLAKEVLRRKSVPFEEAVLDGKPEETEALISRTGLKTVPQIFINGRLIGGCSDMMELDGKGRLDPLLQAPSS